MEEEMSSMEVEKKLQYPAADQGALVNEDPGHPNCSRKIKARVAGVDEKTTVDELITIYSAWSEAYDDEAVTDGYVGPQKGVLQLANFLKSKSAKILDVGAGTGLVGEELKKFGYNDIDALDVCESMLAKAREKGIYKEHFVGAIGGSKVIQSIPANSYDATICVGVFSIGHVKAKGIDDLLHVTKPGGLVCVTIREDVLNDPAYGLYQAKIDQLESDGRIKVLYRDMVDYIIDYRFKSILLILEKIQ